MLRSKSTALLVLALTLGAAGAIAQQKPTDEEQRLKAVETDLNAAQSEATRLQAEAENTARELNSIRKSLVELAAEVQTQETALNALEEQSANLRQEEALLQSKLGLRDDQMQRVAMALQRMALRPTDAVTLSPLNPDDAVRTAILLRAMIPELKASALTLEGDLAKLYQVRNEMDAQQQRVATASTELTRKRRNLESREQEKAKLQQQLSAASVEATAKSKRLADEARDLRDLVAKVLAARALEAQKEAEKQAAAAKAAKDAPKPNSKVALKPPPGLASKSPPGGELRAFSEARGTMPFPAVGSLKRRYGEAGDEPAALSKGIIIAARAGGQVVAPFDGVVAFAGPFRGYGLLLIIEHSEGYHTLLSGLGRIDCVLDQRVFAGEPVGAMTNDGSPELYVELRQNGQPVNPLPWLVSRTVGKSNG